MQSQSMAADEAKLAKKLAKKKLKVAAAAALASEPAPADSTAQDPEKKSKKKRKLAEAGAAESPQEEAATEEKPKKKKKKSKQTEGEKQAPLPVEAVSELAGEKKKKKKKKKGSAEVVANGGNGIAHKESVGRVVEQPAASEVAKIGSLESMKRGKPLRKTLYQQSAEVDGMSEAVVQAWKDERAIAVEGCSLRPILKFSQTGLSEVMLHGARKFTSPSPIQSQCLPIALSGRDMVGIAATGSGKTIAFGLPCLMHIQAQREARNDTGGAPRALMISPTRELAQQIAAVMEEAGERCGVKTLCVYGGVPKQPQAKQLRKGVDVVVATPGRLEDLINDGACRVEQVSYLVLDEADRMLDLGFEPHIRNVAARTRADRQTLMFSATWPAEVQKLAMEYLARPARVVIGSQDLSASHSVQQIVEVIEPEARERRLLELLKKYHSSRRNRVLVFVLYKKEASRVEERLNKAGWKAASIHGDINQNQRSKAVEQFKSGEMPLLIATDVAARGLDIPDVEAVINYSFPLTTEDYVHRIGRTGRAGKTGVAHTFFSGATDKPRSGELINVLKEAGQPVPDNLLAFGTTTKKKESKMYGAHFKEIDPNAKATKIVFDD